MRWGSNHLDEEGRNKQNGEDSVVCLTRTGERGAAECIDAWARAYFLGGEESHDITCGVRENASSRGKGPLSDLSEVGILFAES